MESNFNKLQKIDTVLAKIAKTSETLFLTDYSACVGRVGLFAETLTKKIYAKENIDYDETEDQYSRILFLEESAIITSNVVDCLHEIRKYRNRVEHHCEDALSTNKSEAVYLLKMEFDLANWYMNRYYNFQNRDSFIKPHKEEMIVKQKDYPKETIKSKLDYNESEIYKKYLEQKNIISLGKIVIAVQFITLIYALLSN